MTQAREYLSFDPSSCGFPAARAPVLPLPGWQSFHWQRQDPIAALLDAPNARFYSRGRYALTQAFRLCGVGPDRPLLVPAYHCRTMLDPAISLGAGVTLYPLRPDLQPDLDALEQLLRQQPRRHAALLATHFFGFEQALDAVEDLCNRHGIALVEDCSHAMFLPSLPGRIGKRGRYVVASPYKFFAIEDGGILWANHGAPLPEQDAQAPAWLKQCKGAARALQKARSHCARAAGAPNDLPAHTGATRTGAAPAGLHRRHSSSGTSHLYDTSAENDAGLQVSRQLMLRSDIHRITQRRQHNYQAWIRAVAGMPHCRALYTSVAPDCVPYMFPLWIAHPDTHFAALKQRGLPVWRWDDMAVSDCPSAMQYRTHLLHLPCHQELTRGQLDWMIRAATLALSEDAR